MLLPTVCLPETGLLPCFVHACSQLAPISAVMVSASPLPTILKINQTKNVGNMPLLPYSTLAANCMLWTTYGIMESQASIWVPNALGVLLALYYVSSFVKHSPRQSPTLPGSIRQHLNGVQAVGMAALAGGSFLTPETIGSLAVLFCIGLFASPLSTVRTVIAQRSAASIPVPFTVVSILNCFFWSVSGVLDLHDANVVIPNVLGLLFGLAQMALISVYGDGKQNNLNAWTVPAP